MPAARRRAPAPRAPSALVRADTPAAAVRAQRGQHPPPATYASARSGRLVLVGALLAGAWLGRLELPPLLASGFDILLVVASAVVVMLAYRQAARRRLERARTRARAVAGATTRPRPPQSPSPQPRPRQRGTDGTTSSRPPAAAG